MEWILFILIHIFSGFQILHSILIYGFSAILEWENRNLSGHYFIKTSKIDYFHPNDCTYFNCLHRLTLSFLLLKPLSSISFSGKYVLKNTGYKKCIETGQDWCA